MIAAFSKRLVEKSCMIFFFVQIKSVILGQLGETKCHLVLCSDAQYQEVISFGEKECFDSCEMSDH